MSMSILEAIVLGAVQGATEFLPVSSSGHLVLGQHLLGMKEPGLLFDIVLHVGTLLSVLIFYRRDIQDIVLGLLQGLRALLTERSITSALEPSGARLATLVVLATLPTGVLGLLLEKLLDPEPGQEPIITPVVVCGILIINGFVLMTNRFFLEREQSPDYTPPSRETMASLWNIAPWVALVIGIAQGVAVFPGISRSGMTITVALALGVQRLHAARYSFLLSIPAILGALVLKLDLSLFSGEQGSQALLAFGLGALTASIVGYLCLFLLTRMLQNARFHHFAWYCWLVGIVGLVSL